MMAGLRRARGCEEINIVGVEKLWEAIVFSWILDLKLPVNEI